MFFFFFFFKVVFVNLLIFFIPIIFLKILVFIFFKIFYFLIFLLFFFSNFSKFLIILLLQKIRLFNMRNRIFNVSLKREDYPEGDVPSNILDSEFFSDYFESYNRQRLFSQRKVYYFTNFYSNHATGIDKTDTKILKYEDKIKKKRFHLFKLDFVDRINYNLNSYIATKFKRFNRKIRFKTNPIVRMKDKGVYKLLQSTGFYNNFFSFVNKNNYNKIDSFYLGTFKGSRRYLLALKSRRIARIKLLHRISRILAKNNKRQRKRQRKRHIKFVIKNNSLLYTLFFQELKNNFNWIKSKNYIKFLNFTLDLEKKSKNARKAYEKLQNTELFRNYIKIIKKQKRKLKAESRIFVILKKRQLLPKIRKLKKLMKVRKREVAKIEALNREILRKRTIYDYLTLNFQIFKPRLISTDTKFKKTVDELKRSVINDRRTIKMVIKELKQCKKKKVRKHKRKKEFLKFVYETRKKQKKKKGSKFKKRYPLPRYREKNFYSFYNLFENQINYYKDVFRKFKTLQFGLQIINFFKQYNLVIYDLNRISWSLILHSTIMVYVSSIFVYFDLNHVFYGFLALSFGYSGMYLENYFVAMSIQRDSFFFSQLMFSFTNKKILEKTKPLNFITISKKLNEFIKNPFLFLNLVFNNKKNLLNFLILTFFFLIIIFFFF
jgi:hypothetical protein